MTKNELNEIIRNHELWMKGKAGMEKCADLSGADLSDSINGPTK